MIDLKMYETEDGVRPFEVWANKIRSKDAKSRVFKSLNKLELGLISDCKSVGEGVQEIRLHFEKGYRLYFGHDGDKLIILLLGSTKAKQASQIENAKKYWKDYKQQKKERSKIQRIGHQQ